MIWMEENPVDTVIDLLHHDTWKVVLLALAEVAVMYILGGLAKKAIMKLSDKATYKGVMTFSASLASIAIRICGVIIALDQLGVSMNIIIGAISGLGVGIALALKDNMASVASGLQILMTRPFEIGDYVKIGSHKGVVTSIEITYVTLQENNHQTSIIPNNRMISKNVTNYSRAPKKKMTITLPVNRDDLDEAQKTLQEKAASCPLVLKDPAPAARISKLQSDTAAISLIFYADRADCWKAYDAVMDLVKHYRPSPRKADPTAADLSKNIPQQ